MNPDEEMLAKANQFAMKELMDSCPAKAALGGVMGGAMGGNLMSHCFDNL